MELPSKTCEPHRTRYLHFIQTRPFRNKKKEKGFALHHIFPKSLGGTSDSSNLIKLTLREHFIAHLILWKCCGGKMTYAFRQMCTHHSFEKMVTARIYENVKKDIIVSRETIEKRSQANTGKKRTQEQCARISEAKKKNMTNEARKKIGNGRRGAKASKETLQKMREATTERWKNPEYAEKQSQLHKGHKHSEEQRKRIGDSNRGKKRSEEACKNIRVPHPRMKGKGAKKIECIELKRIFSSLTEAQNWLKSQNLGAGIYNSLINAKLRTGGYHWRYVDEQV